MKNKVKLFETKPRRLFVFGCSFTDYMWITWANILAKDLNIPWYNYAASGAGNRFIATRIAVADAHHKFDKDDLVMVCWTNVARIDRYSSEEQRWHLFGNIYNNENYTVRQLKKIDQTDLFLRDMAYISLAQESLKQKTNCHFMQMLDITKWYDQQHETPFVGLSQRMNVTDDVKTPFQHALNDMLPSFYDRLWQDNLSWKLKWNRKNIHDLFWDTHPLPGEHFKFLIETFDHKFQQSTIDHVKHIHEYVCDYVERFLNSTKKDPGQINEYLGRQQNIIKVPQCGTDYGLI